MWEEPSLAHFFHRLTRVGRVICFDKRGTGVSDPVPLAALPTLEEWMDDARVALDAADSHQAAVIGDTEGGPMAMLLAATFPERVSGLVLLNTFARWRRAPDYPIGMPDPTWRKLVFRYEKYWGQDAGMLGLTAPSLVGDARAEEWFTRYQRLSMPPGAASRMYRWVTQLDLRSVLPRDIRPDPRATPKGQQPLSPRFRPLPGPARPRSAIGGAPGGGLLPLPHPSR